MKPLQILGTLFLVTCIGCAQSAGTQTCHAKNGTTALYSGRLLGYFRDPPNEPFSSGWNPKQHFLDAKADVEKGTCHSVPLVGTGDNFGPAPGMAPESRTKLPCKIEDDGVAKFLRKAGFQAITIGREDFLSGAPRLHQVAQLLTREWLEKEKENKPYEGVAVLAGNVVIRTKDNKGEPREQEAPDFAMEVEGIAADVDGPVLPWQTELRFKLDSSKICPVDIEQVELCTTRSGHPTSKDRCSPVKSLSSGETLRVSLNVDDQSKLIGDEHYILRVTRKGDLKAKRKPFGFPFHMERPFVYPDRPDHDNDLPTPWRLLAGEGGRPDIVVFGIVDGNLRSQIPRENAIWVDPADKQEPKEESEVHVFPPEQVLGEMVQAFEEKYKRDKGSPFKGIKILLAQMPPAAASELAASFRCPLKLDPQRPCFGGFNLVISKSDEDHVTGNTQMTFEQSDRTVSQVVTPNSAYSARNHELRVPLYSLEITYPAKDKVAYDNRFRGGPPQPSVHLDCTAYSDSDKLKYRLCRAEKTGGSDSVREKIIEDTLIAMVEVGHADVAMLQQRDFFWDWADDFDFEYAMDASETPGKRLVRRIVWKRDLLTTVSLTGAQIKKILEQSQTYEAEETSPTRPRDMRDRSIKCRGIYKQGKDYYIAGDKLGETRLYKVATSSYVANGDTGYAEFRSPAVEKQKMFRNGVAIPLSELAYAKLKACADGKLSTGRVAGVPRAELYSGVPFHYADERPRQGYVSELAKDFAGWFSTHPFKRLKPGDAERQLQFQPLHHFSLMDLSFSFTLVSPNAPASRVKSVFGNTSFPGVSNSFRHKSWEVSYHPRHLYEHPHYDVGLEHQFEYSSDSVQDPDSDTPTETNPKNLYWISPLLQFHYHKYFPNWKILVLRPMRFESRVVGDRFDLPDAFTAFPELHLDKVRAISQRIGSRLEKNSENWVELGYQLKQSFNILDRLVVNSGLPGERDCDSHEAQPITACLKDLVDNNLVDLTVRPVPHYRTSHQNGLFWDAQLTVPLPMRFSFVGRTQGDKFQRSDGDTQGDTDYDVLTKLGLKMPVPGFGNLAVQPTYELFFFKNKVAGNTLSRDTISIKLTYTFERYTNTGWVRAMKFKAPGNAEEP